MCRTTPDATFSIFSETQRYSRQVDLLRSVDPTEPIGNARRVTEDPIEKTDKDQKRQTDLHAYSQAFDGFALYLTNGKCSTQTRRLCQNDSVARGREQARQPRR
jgi:hypothetical protein